MKKTINNMVIIFVLIISAVIICKTDVHAAYVFNSFESEMKVGTKQFENGSIYWISDDGTQLSADVTATTTAQSSDSSIVKAWVERPSGYTSYFVYLEGVSQGTATVTINFADSIYQFDVTIVGEDQGKMDCCKEDLTLKKSEVYEFETVIGIRWGNVVKYVTNDELVVTSSNESVVSVTYDYMFDDYLSDIELTALKAGTATITVKVETDDTSNQALNGFTDSFTITVTEDPKVGTPKILTQLKTGYSLSSDTVSGGFEVMEGDIEYELWVSPYKNKGFKKGAWAKSTFYVFDHLIDSSDHDYSYDAKTGDIKSLTVKKYGKKKLKANKKYYVKMRARYIGGTHSNEWSAWSKVQEYWTAPAKIKDSKIKFNAKTRKVTFPKVSGIKGYTYHTTSIEKQGYNILGNPVYFSVTERRTTTKRSFKVSTLKYKMKPEQVYSVWPYAKHGKYYYVEGYAPVKSLKKFRYWDSSKYAGH